MNITHVAIKLAKSAVLGAACYSAVSAIGLVSGFAGNAYAPVAFAQESQPKQKTRKTPAMRNAVYEKIAKASEAAQAKDYEGALEVLGDLRRKHDSGKSELNSYELANVFGQFAFIYYSQEKYDQAISYNEKVVEQPDIPEGLEINTRYTIAQLYFVVENYPKAVKALEDWFNVEQNPAADAYVLLAQGYYQVNQYDDALASVEKAMVVAKSKGKEPKEQWYLLMRALYFDKNDMKKVAWVLEELARKWPKRDYFSQMSSVYAQLNNDKGQLAAHDIAYAGWGFDNESGLLNMGYLYMGNDTPYRGATTIESGLKDGIIRKSSKNYGTVGQAYSMAQESSKALPYMLKAAETADDGQPWARLANVYFDTERYNDALKAAREAIDKGGLRQPENTRVLIGMSLFNLDKLSEAKAEFRRASKSEKTEKVARQWIKYIDGEIKRRSALEKI